MEAFGEVVMWTGYLWGISRGIWWDFVTKRHMEKIDEAVDDFSASYKFRVVSFGVEWAFSGVYRLHLVSDRWLL